MFLWYNGGLCQSACWYSANKMVNVWAIKPNPCSLLKERPNLLSCLAGSFVHLGSEEEIKRKWWNVQYKKYFQCLYWYLLKHFLHLLPICLFITFESLHITCIFFIPNQKTLGYFHIWSAGDKPMFDFLVKVMCSIWICAPDLILPTHTVHVHNSLSWLTEGTKARGGVSSSEEKAEMMESLHGMDGHLVANCS